MDQLLTIIMNKTYIPYYVSRIIKLYGISENDKLFVLKNMTETGIIELTCKEMQCMNYDMNYIINAVIIACKNGHNDVIRILVKSFNFDKRHIHTDDNYILNIVCENGYTDIVYTLVELFDFCENDVSKNDNYVLRIACKIMMLI